MWILNQNEILQFLECEYKYEAIWKYKEIQK